MNMNELESQQEVEVKIKKICGNCRWNLNRVNDHENKTYAYCDIDYSSYYFNDCCDEWSNINS